MANKEHIEIIQSGAAAWNKWRDQNREIRPNLAQANLNKMNLIEANFDKVILIGASLKGTNVRNANFREADLHGAHLVEANMSFAELAYANLANTELRETNFLGANLSHANFDSARLYHTILGGANLKSVRNLGSCVHLGPSVIDHQTIAKARKLPLTFLRGCGLPDSLIDYLPSLLNEEPIQFYSCFISHSHRDEDFAKRLHSDLQNNNVRCWFAPEDLKIGDKIVTAIDESIRVYEKLLLVLSESSIESSWVEYEVQSVLEKESKQGQKVLFPVRIDDAVLNSKIEWASRIKSERYIGDFRKWKSHDVYQKAFDRLLRELKANNIRAKKQ